MPEVLYEVDGRVATVTLNRPDRLNALTMTMLSELHDALWRAERDRDVWAIVLTGAGRGFCAGTDLQDLAAAAPDVAAGLAFSFDPRHAPILAMQQIDTPLIAAVNGPTAGYGVGIALNADIRVMAADARLVPPTTRNLVPESGDTYLLPRLIGWEQAARFYFLGEELTASEALRIGVVSELADNGPAAVERATTLAARIVSMPPAGVQAAKRMMRSGRDERYPDHVHHVLMQLLPLLRTKDFAEAVAAWLERRPPNYTGE